MLVDTNIFIDFLKENPQAKYFFEKEVELTTSVLVVMEIIAGLPKKADIMKLEKFIQSANIAVLSIDEQVSKQGYRFFREYHHSTKLSIPDALIAATAYVFGEELVTLNIKHFHKLKEISLVKPY